MGRWLKQAGKEVKKLANSSGIINVDQLQQQFQQQMGGDWVSSGTIDSIKIKGQRCVQLSRETMEICQQTATKRQQMIDFASEIQTTMSAMTTTSGGADASILATICTLTDGSQVKQAMDLAHDVQVVATSCVEKSVEMLDLMEGSVDSLPDPVQTALKSFIDNGSGNDKDETDSLLKGLDDDVRDIQNTIQALKSFNLNTALKIGLQAFTSLTEKSKRSQALFDSVRSFAKDVYDITETFKNLDIASMSAKSRDMLRCIGLCETMRQTADGAGKLVRILIDLFAVIADRISALWAALAFAKDCMQDSVAVIDQTRGLCLDAQEKSTALITKSSAIRSKLESVGEVNRESFKAIQSLTQGSEIQDTIDLVRSMDHVVIECTEKVTGMVDRVTEGFRNIPPILTDGIDMDAVGRQKGDPEPLDFEKDVKELQESRKAMENSDLLSMARTGTKGFAGVSDKASLCKDTMGLVNEFAKTCSTTIASFLSVWSLESASRKIEDMCRLVKLGEIMKQFAQQVKQLILAILDLLNTALTKFDKGFPDLPNNVGQVVDSAKDSFQGALSDAKDHAGDAIGFVKGKIKSKIPLFK